ncbi:hypothetical protein BTVI_66718 [Pitangus sulphuratus]|nr:hypothetical protein BTVI_66718 [Pitangus sulphuratus]
MKEEVAATIVKRNSEVPARIVNSKDDTRVAEDICILSIWPCEFNKEMQTSLHFQVRGIINTNQHKDQQKDYRALAIELTSPHCLLGKSSANTFSISGTILQKISSLVALLISCSSSPQFFLACTYETTFEVMAPSLGFVIQERQKEMEKLEQDQWKATKMMRRLEHMLHGSKENKFLESQSLGEHTVYRSAKPNKN